MSELTESPLPADEQAQGGGVVAALLRALWDLSPALIVVLLGVLLYHLFFPPAFWQARELQRNVEKWQSQHITHYRMVLMLPLRDKRLPLTVEVKGGVVVSVTDAQGRPVSPKDDKVFHGEYPSAFTVAGLFAKARNWIWKQPPKIELTYDAALGYPSAIGVQRWTDPAGDWMSYSVRSLQVLK